jgi:hypothetical protein
VGPEVERDAWVDQASFVSGSGHTRFDSELMMAYSRSPGTGFDVSNANLAPAGKPLMARVPASIIAV